MQATQPVRTTTAPRAGFLAVVAAAVILIVATIAANVAPSFFAATDAGTGAGAAPAPLLLDPDTRDGVGRFTVGAPRAQ